ncbi:MAG: type II toxin-antitoxin system VapC family toxin [Candidatus Poribacteria bacterium]|nr:type II toxin-antitoxin system VapC family toxin [Candidatus Poribacteria bacterium]
MAVKVIDTSALAAVAFAEPDGQRIAVQLEEHDLIAPHLLPFELANVCLTKIRRHPVKRELLLAGYEMISRLPLTFMAVNMTEVVTLAEAKQLTAYDASFLWLAQQLAVELVTLDKTLAKQVSPRKAK